MHLHSPLRHRDRFLTFPLPSRVSAMQAPLLLSSSPPWAHTLASRGQQSLISFLGPGTEDLGGSHFLLCIEP